MVNVFVHAIRKRLQKCLVQKVGNFGSLGLIPVIEQPFCSSCVAVQCETGTIPTKAMGVSGCLPQNLATL